MKNIKSIIWASAALPMLVLSEAPLIREGSVTLGPLGNTSYYEIGYILDDVPAVITVDVQTNGVSIGGEKLVNMTGDLGRVIQPGSRKVLWQARNMVPNQVFENATAVVTAWVTNNPPPYMVLSMDSVTPPVYYASTNTIPHWGENTNRLYKTDKIVLKKIPAANVRWRMGSPTDETCRNTGGREIAHWVTLTENYYMGVYPCTQYQYKLLTGNSGGPAFKDYEDYNYRPVGKIPYYVVRGGRSNGIDWPTSGTNVTANSVIGHLRSKALCSWIDLPTEAQWEFACRADEGAALYNGKELTQEVWTTGAAPSLYDLGWYAHNCKDDTPDGVAQTHEVGKKQPNAWGLYDMLGNVYEWCLDWDSSGAEYSDGSPVVDPEGIKVPSTYHRICRGGCYEYAASECRSACRGRGSDENSWYERHGFRFCAKALAK